MMIRQATTVVVLGVAVVLSLSSAAVSEGSNFDHADVVEVVETIDVAGYPGLVGPSKAVFHRRTQGDDCFVSGDGFRCNVEATISLTDSNEVSFGIQVDCALDTPGTFDFRGASECSCQTTVRSTVPNSTDKLCPCTVCAREYGTTPMAVDCTQEYINGVLVPSEDPFVYSTCTSVDCGFTCNGTCRVDCPTDGTACSFCIDDSPTASPTASPPTSSVIAVQHFGVGLLATTAALLFVGFGFFV